jgi:hypothetical protein
MTKKKIKHYENMKKINLKREQMESDNKNKMKEMNEKHKLDLKKADIKEKEQNNN